MSLLGIKSFFCECPVLTKPIQLVSIGQEVHFDGLLLSRLKDGVLPWGSPTIVADEIGVTRSTIGRLLGQPRLSHEGWTMLYLCGRRG